MQRKPDLDKIGPFLVIAAFAALILAGAFWVGAQAAAILAGR